MRKTLSAPAASGLAASVLAAFALAGAASAQPAVAKPALTPLPDLVARYVAWRGGDAFRRLKRLHTVGVVEDAGLTGPFEGWESDEKARNQFDLGGVRILEVITPQGSWTTNASGQVVDEPDAYEYLARDPDSAVTMEGDGKGKVALLGMEDTDGRAWEVARVTFGDADTYDEFIDPKSGELGATRVTQKGQTQFEHYGDWRMADGVRIAFTTRVEAADLGVQTVRVTRAEVNPPFDPALFVRPQATRRAAFAAGGDTGWIDFASSREDRVYLPVTVGGQAMTAIFDSGATTTAVDAGVLTLLGHTASGAFPTPGENGVGAAGVASGIDLGIGGLTLHGLTVASMDITSLRAKSGEPWDVILGDEVFYETIVDLDFPHQRVAFHDPAGWQPPPGALMVPLARDGDDRLVPLSLDGGPPALFVLDTGFTGSLRIAPALARRQGLLSGQVTLPVTIGAIGGDATGVIADVNHVALGGVGFTEVPALFSDTWPSASYTDRVGGLLGLGILSKFRVIVDWPQDRLYLIQEAGDAATVR
jgi:predicted aspartyl protease